MAPSLLATPDAQPPAGSSAEGWSVAAPAPQAPADAPASPQDSQDAGGARWVNSLTIDTSGNTAGSGYAVFLGGDAGSTAAGGAATLSISSGALVFQGGNNETIYGGQIGACCTH